MTITNDTVIIDNEKDDDWMKTLPGYKDEIALHEDLEKKHKSGKRGKAKFHFPGTKS